jgi:hypothetical protein
VKKQQAEKLRHMEQSIRRIADVIAPQLPKGTGFALLVFDFGEKGHASYISNASREDMIKALREQADRLETRTTAPPGMPNHPANNPGEA